MHIQDLPVDALGRSALTNVKPVDGLACFHYDYTDSGAPIMWCANLSDSEIESISIQGTTYETVQPGEAVALGSDFEEPALSDGGRAFRIEIVRNGNTRQLTTSAAAGSQQKFVIVTGS